MTPDQLRQLQAPIKARYKAHPDAAKHTFRAIGRLLPDRPSVRVDTAFALESLVACAGVTFKVVATALGIGFRSAQVVVEGEGAIAA